MLHRVRCEGVDLPSIVGIRRPCAQIWLDSNGITVLPATHTNHIWLYSVSVRHMAPPQPRLQTSICSLLLIYRRRKDERLSWPGWLTCSGWFTHISGHQSAASRAQDRESSPTKDRRSTTVPHNQVSSGPHVQLETSQGYAGPRLGQRLGRQR